eukprot:TRINITY_DN6335_c0_g1_i16.p1 TRINITY_DN6335_c0_g1~~TRINITY_DN6335_c0_g1_i16.p1  ORF type:complete len:185 (-),score=40.50 TRINITY_DN6335_c0_g1_i16:341-895(-)
MGINSTSFMTTSKTLLVLLVAFAAMVSADDFQFYDKCDDRWDAELYGTPGICQESHIPTDRVEREASSFTLIASLMKYHDLPCFGINPCTPLILKQKLGSVDGFDKFSKELGIQVSVQGPSVPQIKKDIQAGYQAIIQTSSGELFLAFDAVLEGIIAIDARGFDDYLPDIDVKFGWILKVPKKL